MAANGDPGPSIPVVAAGVPPVVIEGDPARTAWVLRALEDRGLRVLRWRPPGILASSSGSGAGAGAGAVESEPGEGPVDVWVVEPCHALIALEAMQPMRAMPPMHPEKDSAAVSGQSLEGLEWAYIQRVLSECGGNISATARRLGIHRRSLQRKLGKVPPSR